MAPVSPTCLRLAARLRQATARRWRRSGGLALVPLLLLAACAAAPQHGSDVRITALATQDGISLVEGDAPVLHYQSRALPGREPWRLHYVHPLHSVGGAVITEDAPTDHLHHRGVFWAWRRILLDGTPVADGWVGQNLTLEVSPPRARTFTDGSAQIDARVYWVVQLDGKATRIIEENSSIRAFPLAQGARRVDFVVRLRALRPGVALAGTADEKGYGGIALRFGQSERLEIVSGGRDLRATVAGMETGERVEFRWRDAAPPWPARVTASCTVDDRAWTRWVLRQEPSMQNCAFPGAQPVAIPTGRAISLATTLLIE